MSNSPLISVVICSYNRVRTLGPAIESAAFQIVDGPFYFEIVIIDDGSTDGTEEVVRQIAGRSPVPVRYVRASGEGIPFARNRGVLEARGEWIAFFDDDQIAEAGWLNALILAAQETGAQIVGGVRRRDFMEGDPPRLGPHTREILGEKYYGAHLCRSNRFTLACTGNVLINRKLLSQIGPFDADMRRGMSDIDWMRRALDAGISSWYSPHAVVRHLIPPHRQTEDYLKWTCLRVGTNLSQINFKSWGPAKMLLPCLLRAGHALTINLIMELTWRIVPNPPAKMERKCYRWIAAGSSRMAANLLLPKVCGQENFFEQLAFRVRRGADTVRN
jgi:glycosyltransferase involved in cell wall biosynthesis